MKIVLITRDRPELTKQTIESMEAHAAHLNRQMLLVVFDGTEEEYESYPLAPWLQEQGIDYIYTLTQIGVGGAKNFGVKWFESDVNDPSFWPDDEIIMFSDNDMYYLPGWDARLEQQLENILHDGPIQLGGWKHPYHVAKPLLSGLNTVDAATGNCFVIKYKDWLKYGPFDANAIGPGQSEDYALSQRIVKAGGIVCSLDPPVAIHCGLANCEGKAAVGWEEMAVLAEKQIKENNIKKIWLATPDEGVVLLEKREETPVTFSGINVGSGQRRFSNTHGWCNVDRINRPPGQVCDVVLDANKLISHFGEGTQDMVVLHHVLEHFGCGEADEVLRQSFGVLKSGGSLLVFVPDLRKLAGRWLSREIDTFTFMVNTYGAYQGEDGDRHKWGYDTESLHAYLKSIPGTGQIKLFDWRDIPGADIAKDWWVLGMEIVKTA